MRERKNSPGLGVNPTAAPVDTMTWKKKKNKVVKKNSPRGKNQTANQGPNSPHPGKGEKKCLSFFWVVKKSTTQEKKFHTKEGVGGDKKHYGEEEKQKGVVCWQLIQKRRVKRLGLVREKQWWGKQRGAARESAGRKNLGRGKKGGPKYQRNQLGNSANQEKGGGKNNSSRLWNKKTICVRTKSEGGGDGPEGEILRKPLGTTPRVNGVNN